MNKEWRNMLLFLGFIVVISLIFIYEPEENTSSDEYVYTPNIENISKNIQTTEDQFPNIKELHWGHMPLTYQVINRENCGNLGDKEINLSFEILQNNTDYLVKFILTDENPDILVNCINLKDEYKKREKEISSATKICKNLTYEKPIPTGVIYEISGLNKSDHYILTTKIFLKTGNSSKIMEICYIQKKDLSFDPEDNLPELPDPDQEFGIIIETQGIAFPNFSSNLAGKGLINFYIINGWKTCSGFPTKVIHEILHLFGFDHSREENDLLFPLLKCWNQKEINQKYLSCLKYIYSNGEYPGDCSQVNFLEAERGKCPDGTFEVEGTEFCCPEPNMIIKDGYCERG